MKIIDAASFLAEVERLLRPGTDDPAPTGWTVAELCIALQASDVRIRRALQNLKRQGRLGIGQKAIQRLDGNRTHVPCYFYLPPTPENDITPQMGPMQNGGQE